jgi:hypothetical protein
MNRRLLRTAVLVIPLDLDRVRTMRWDEAGIVPTYFVDYLCDPTAPPGKGPVRTFDFEAVMYVISSVAMCSTMFQAMTIDAPRVFPNGRQEWVLNLDSARVPEGVKRLRSLPSAPIAS